MFISIELKTVVYIVLELIFFSLNNKPRRSNHICVISFLWSIIWNIYIYTHIYISPIS